MPRRTVRLRLTALYGALFLISGAALLGVVFALTASQPLRTSFAIVVRGPNQQVKIKPGENPCTALGLPCPPTSPGGPRFIRGAAVPVGRVVQGQVIGEVQATLPTPGEVRRFLVVAGIALGVMALLSIWLGWLMAGRALRPLRTMTATARQISEESLHQRLAVHGPQDEMKDLGDTIDDLLNRLETAFDAQRRFVANASHELRTPLAMMRTSLDVAMGKPDPAADVRTLAGKLEEGLDQADKLLEGLLVLARAQQGAPGPSVEVSLADLVDQAVEANGPDIDHLDLAVDNATTDAPVMGNSTLLAHMVSNVIDNAVRHNVPGGTVHIFSEILEDRIRLVVDSGGPVIDAERAHELGEPFRRLGADRVANGRGAGLGLSIVKAIASAHGGQVQLRARPTGGLRVVIELPVARAPVVATHP
jgi:hypothetical protein